MIRDDRADLYLRPSDESPARVSFISLAERVRVQTGGLLVGWRRVDRRGATEAHFRGSVGDTEPSLNPACKFERLPWGAEDRLLVLLGNCDDDATPVTAVARAPSESEDEEGDDLLGEACDAIADAARRRPSGGDDGGAVVEDVTTRGGARVAAPTMPGQPPPARPSAAPPNNANRRWNTNANLRSFAPTWSRPTNRQTVQANGATPGAW